MKEITSLICRKPHTFFFKYPKGIEYRIDLKLATVLRKSQHASLSNKFGGFHFIFKEVSVTLIPKHLSRSVEVLKLKNFKKDATLKLSKSTNQEWYEHVGPEVASSQDGKVMAIFVILVSLDSSEESVGTPAGQVILFGSIPTHIPDTTPIVTPPATHLDTTLIPTEILTVSPIIPPSPDYTPASPNFSPVSDTEIDPSEDPSSDHIPPLPATSPFLSSTDDSLDSDTPDTPPSPTHGTPFTDITLST
ncbi:hypothetical protein Tco_1106143 [Tanacetum coccineum]